MSKPMQIVIGNPATDNNFYPRDAICNKLLLAMAVEHVLFLAPRRTGKTSVLLHLQAQAPCRTVFLNLEEFNHPRLWIQKMAQELSRIQDNPLWQNLKQLGGQFHRLKTKYGHIEAAEWTAKASGLTKDLGRLGEPVWFLLDEFPTMIDLIAKNHGVALAEETLHWLRSTRQENIASPVRFLLTGSIGLDSVLRRHGIRGVANDFRRETLKPLQEKEALEMALKLAEDNGIALEASFALAYIQRLGPARWPFFIQLFLAELQDAESPYSLDQVYQNIALSNRNQYASNMRDRLKEIFEPAEADIARQLLRLTAGSDTGLFNEELRSRLANVEDADYGYVLEVLQHDGYLTETDEGRIVFYSHLLRDFWRRKGGRA